MIPFFNHGLTIQANLSLWTFSAIVTLCEAEAAVLVAAACKRSPYDFLGVKSSWDIDPLAY